MAICSLLVKGVTVDSCKREMITQAGGDATNVYQKQLVRPLPLKTPLFVQFVGQIHRDWDEGDLTVFLARELQIDLEDFESQIKKPIKIFPPSKEGQKSK